MAKDRNVPLGIGLLGGNAKVYNTIAEMQKDSKLKAGKVVEVLGYYQAGDGANHKRLIASEDDGSGIQLSNGLWANIVHNGDICYTIFGAKLDGTTNDFESIKKCHNYANTHNINIKLRKSGIINFIGEVVVKTSIDFNNSVILSKDENKTSSYKFINDEDFVKKEINATPFTDTQNYFEFLKEQPNNTVVRIADTEVYTVRDDSGKISQYYRNDLLLHTLRGTTSTTTIGCYDDVSKIEFYTRKMDKPQCIKNFIYKSEMSKNVTGLFNFVIYRDNFTIENVIIDPSLDSMVLDIASAFKGQVFSIINCYNITLKNIIGNNITGLNQSYEFTGRSGYVINLETVTSVIFDNVQLNGSWGAIGNNKINNVIVQNSKLNRFDCHLYCKDIKILNTDLYDWGVMLGDVRGELLVENCNYHLSNIRSYVGIIFNHYGSYGSFTPAKMIFKNIKVYMKGTRNSIIYISNRAGSTFRGEKKIGDIQIDGLEIISDTLKDNIPILNISAGDSYEIGKIQINNLKYNKCKHIYLCNIQPDLLINKTIEVEIKDSVLTNLFDSKPKFKEYFDGKGGYMPNNILDFFVDGTNAYNLIELDLNVHNSKLVLIHNKFKQMSVYGSEILIDLDTENSSFVYNTELKLYDSLVYNTVNPNNITMSNLSSDKVYYYNCIFKDIEFSDNTINQVTLYLTSNYALSNCSLDTKILSDCTGTAVDYFKSWDNLVTKPKGVTAQNKDVTAELSTPTMQYAMELEGGTVKQDYLEYSLEKFKYDKQLEAEQKAKEEPVIPESVKKFMEKYLGTTPKVETKSTPRTFSFDEVDKLNDTLKKL